MYQILPDITKEYILSRVSPEQIMEHYLQLKVDLRAKYTSPLRKDRHPTCNYFYARSGDLLFKDHNGSFVGDCFKVVMALYQRNFPQALEMIASDFALANIPIGEEIKPVRPPEAYEVKKAEIVAHYRPWEQFHFDYWEKFGVSPSTLDFFNVGVVDTAWVNKYLVYRYKDTDPCFAYNFSKDDRKLYFPFRKKSTGESRFMGNSEMVQGYSQLPLKGNLLVITKSQKDVMSLYELGVPAISLQAETIMPSVELISQLKTRFKQIWTLYDFDLTGVRTANAIKREYGIQPILLTNGRFRTKNQGAKDISELIEIQTKPRVQQFVDRLKTEHSLW